MLNKLLELLRNNHLRMKGSFYLGIKALTQVEAIGRSLNPDLNFIILGEPYAMKLIEENITPNACFGLLAEALLARASISSMSFRTTSATFTSGSSTVRFNIPLEHKIDPEGFEPLRKTLDSIANRLANAILASSVPDLLQHPHPLRLPPKVGSVPIIGLIGLIWGWSTCASALCFPSGNTAVCRRGIRVATHEPGEEEDSHRARWWV